MFFSCCMCVLHTLSAVRSLQTKKRTVLWIPLHVYYRRQHIIFYKGTHAVETWLVIFQDWGKMSFYSLHDRYGCNIENASLSCNNSFFLIGWAKPLILTYLWFSTLMWLDRLPAILLKSHFLKQIMLAGMLPILKKILKLSWRLQENISDTPLH